MMSTMEDGPVEEVDVDVDVEVAGRVAGWTGRSTSKGKSGTRVASVAAVTC